MVSHAHVSQKLLSPFRLTRNLSAPETWGFGFTGHISWLNIAPAIHAALGLQALFVWLPAMVVGMLTIHQVKRLGNHFIDVAGGTPSYTTKLLQRYPGIARYAALGYFFSWVASLPINAILLTDLVRVNLETMHIACPLLPLKLGFTLITFVLAFSGTRALSILHLFFVIPSLGLLLAFCVQGMSWLTLLPSSPSLGATHWSLLSFEDWAKWYFFASYATYACETASAYVADSCRPKQTLGFLPVAASFMPVIFLGGSWVLAQLVTSDFQGDPFLSFVAAAQQFWGPVATPIVTFLLTAASLLTCATTVSNCPRILYQLALDGHIAPVFAVVSRRGVFGPGLLLVLVLSLLCLVWVDIAQIVVVSNVGWFISFMGLRLGLWLRRGRPEVIFPLLSLGIFIVEAVILLVGGIAWGWQECLIGLLFPIGILIVDRAIRRIPFSPFHPQWWMQQYRSHPAKPIKDWILVHVVILIVLLGTAVVTGWCFHAILSPNAKASNSLIVVLLLVVAFVGVAIACWTSFPQVVALNEAREAAEHLFALARDGIMVVDEKGIIQRINLATESLLQQKSNSLIKSHLNQIFPNLAKNPEDWPTCSAQTIFLPHQAKGIIVELSVSNLSYQNFQGYMVMMHDESAVHNELRLRQERDAASRLSEQNLRTLFNAVHDALLIHDTDGKILDVNDRMLQMYGVTREQAPRLSISQDYSSPANPLENLSTIWQKVLGGEMQRFEWIARRPNDGFLFDVEVILQKVILNDKEAILGNVRDITSRKQAEAALQESEARFRTLVANMPGVIYRFLLKADGTASFPYMSSFCRQIYEIEPEVILEDAMPLVEMIHQDDRAEFEASLAHAAENLEYWCHEHRIITPSGKLKWVRGASCPQRQENGDIVWDGLIMDVSDRKLAEAALRNSEAQLRQQTQELQQALRELRQTQAQLVQTEKMSSLGQLVAGVAHEINNPVNFIYGNLIHANEYTQNLIDLLQLYQQCYPQSLPEIETAAEAMDLNFLLEDLPKLLASMQVGAQRIQTIVLALRNFSRKDEAALKAVDIHEGIDSTLLILHNRLKAQVGHLGIEVIKNYGHLPLVECYPGPLNQVFMNILTNAIDALEERDKQKSLPESQKQPSTILIQTEAIGCDRISIRIADNGPGIPESVQQRLFDPFFTTKPIGKGTGLGMSISYQIVTEKHGGSLQCKSTFGQGAAFVIEIPIYQESGSKTPSF